MKQGQIPGSYVQSFEGHRVFAPTPLPPKDVRLPAYTMLKVEEAAHLLGQVQMCERLLPNSELLTYSSLQLEAIASSTIENTITSPEELVRYQSSYEPAKEATKEVSNYSSALQWGYEQLQQKPITLNLILGLHDLLLSGVRGDIAIGRFKNKQNFIGGTISKPMFTPSAPESVMRLMSDLEKYINSDEVTEPKIVKCAYSHYQFETIHPFSDGNGRIGRLLIVLQTIQLGLLSGPLIYPSVYFEKTRQQYYARLQAVRDHGHWNEWVLYFAEGMIFAANRTIELAQTIMRLQHDLRAQIDGTRKRASVRETLDCFFHQPVRSIRQISEDTGLAYNSVSSALSELCSIGMVREMSGSVLKRRGKIYACDPILKAIFTLPDIPIYQSIEVGQ